MEATQFMLILTVFAAIIYGGSAIQCHECYHENITQAGFNFQQGQPGCLDPFQSSGIMLIECDGQCFANLTTQVSPELFTFESVYRGCKPGQAFECDFLQGCQEFQGTRLCNYCCDGDNCNSKSFEEADADTFKCYHCQAELTPDGMPVDGNTCGRDDFDGTGDPDVLVLPCPSENCITLRLPTSPEGNTTVTRSCATEDGFLALCNNEQFYESFDYDIECCSDKLCNVDQMPPINSTPSMVTLTTKAAQEAMNMKYRKHMMNRRQRKKYRKRD